MVGIYRLFTPCLIIRDPELIKDMSIRNFKNFQDNDVLLNEKTDHVFGRDPFYLRGTEWKAKRSQLTSCFTSGKVRIKILWNCNRNIYPLITVQLWTLNSVYRIWPKLGVHLWVSRQIYLAENWLNEENFRVLCYECNTAFRTAILPFFRFWKKRAVAFWKKCCIFFISTYFRNL